MDNDKILQFIRMKGLVLPMQIASEIKQSSMIAGAVLSDLAKSGKIKISNTKVGGSPVYYLPEHAYKLQELYKHLNEKDKRAYDLLKERKVLRDVSLTPLLRVSYRNIKDFAKPIEVAIGGQKEIFWRWYMLSMSDAEPMIRKIINPEAEKLPIEKEEKRPEEHADRAEKKEQPKTEEPEEKTQQSKPEEQEDEQKKLPVEEPDDELHAITKKFFKSKGIEIENVEVIRKNSEIDYIIVVPSQIGNIRYFAKSKRKKKCNDSDLASAFVKGQLNKLPVLLLTTGELTKKSQEMLCQFDNMKVKNLR